MQHEQSSPHQHGSLMGGFAIGPFAIEGVDELEEAAEAVDGGIALEMWSWHVGEWLVWR